MPDAATTPNLRTWKLDVNQFNLSRSYKNSFSTILSCKKFVLRTGWGSFRISQSTLVIRVRVIQIKRGPGVEGQVTRLWVVVKTQQVCLPVPTPSSEVTDHHRCYLSIQRQFSKHSTVLFLTSGRSRRFFFSSQFLFVFSGRLKR